MTIEAYPCETPTTEAIEIKSDSDVNQLVHTFSGRVNNYIQGWQHIIKSWHKQNKCVVIWGGGSKAVAFLTTLNISLEVHSVVDINPHKHGKYLPGTNHRVIAPQDLVTIQPDIILAMNPMYMSEIKDQLQLMKIECELLPLDNESLNKEFHP